MIGYESNFNAGCKITRQKGELVEASDGYARNFLLPRKLAKEANAQAMNEYKNAENSKIIKLQPKRLRQNMTKRLLRAKPSR